MVLVLIVTILITKKFLNLNHTRLSIIDPTETANQPLMDDKGIIVFNGMIYNYLEVKKKLEKNNEFKTKSDTEVLLKFLNIYGPKNLKSFGWNVVIRVLQF